MAYVIYDRVDRKLVGASQALWFATEDDANLHLYRMSAEEVASGRFALVEVPEQPCP